MGVAPLHGASLPDASEPELARRPEASSGAVQGAALVGMTVPTVLRSGEARAVPGRPSDAVRRRDPPAATEP